MHSEEQKEDQREETVTTPQRDSGETSGAAPQPATDERVAAEQSIEQQPAVEQLLAEERQKAERYLANWQRSAADFQNFKRRTEQEQEERVKFANAMLVLKLLPVVDDLERALDTIPANLAGLTWFDGIRLIYRKLMAVLESEGVSPIPTEGQDFDPRLHEAVLYDPAGERGKVLQELQRGYKLRDRVIRPAMVKVGGGQSEPGETSNTTQGSPEAES